MEIIFLWQGSYISDGGAASETDMLMLWWRCCYCDEELLSDNTLLHIMGMLLLWWRRAGDTDVVRWMLLMWCECCFCVMNAVAAIGMLLLKSCGVIVSLLSSLTSRMTRKSRKKLTEIMSLPGCTGKKTVSKDFCKLFFFSVLKYRLDTIYIRCRRCLVQRFLQKTLMLHKILKISK